MKWKSPQSALANHATWMATKDTHIPGLLEQRVEAIDPQAGDGVKLVASVIDTLHTEMQTLRGDPGVGGDAVGGPIVKAVVSAIDHNLEDASRRRQLEAAHDTFDALHEKMTALQPTSPDVVEMKNAILDALADHRRRLGAADRKTEL